MAMTLKKNNFMPSMSIVNTMSAKTKTKDQFFKSKVSDHNTSQSQSNLSISQ